MDALAPFRIPVSSLKADEARYEWVLDSAFFKLFDEEHDAEQGQFKVIMDLAHAGAITTLEFHIEGTVDSTCDRCLTILEIPVQGEYEMIIKFGDPEQSTDEVVFIDPEANGLNVGKHIYDFVLLSIPIKREIEGCESQDEPPCDFTILRYLTDNNSKDNSSDGDDDSLWGDLKKVIDN